MPFNSIVECPFAQGQTLLGVSKGTTILSNIILDSGWKYLSDNVTKTTVEPSHTKIVQSTSEWKTDYQRLYDELCTKKNVILLGGDHTIGQPSVFASLTKVNSESDLLVIWVDAHADSNTYEKSVSKNFHGMPVAGLLGLEDKWIVTRNDFRLIPENLFYFGIRDLDDFEKETILKLNIFNTQQIDDLLDKVNERIQSNPNLKIHISFDVDSLDPVHFNATGISVEDGVKPHEVVQLLEVCEKSLVCFDITEFNPEMGDIEKSLIALKSIFNPKLE